MILSPIIINTSAAVSYSIDADAGSYTLTGSDAALTATRKIAANAGSYTLTGFDATLTTTSAYELVAESGSYTITGFAATFQYSGAVGGGSPALRMIIANPVTIRS